MKKPVIIDTDLTSDDIAALKILAQSNKADIKAVTLVSEQPKAAFSCAETLCKEIGISCTIAPGAVKPIFKEQYSNDCPYGKTALTYENSMCCEDEKIEYPWDVILDESQKAGGQLEIVALGPLTNVAVTLLRYPQIKPLIKRIFIAAGAHYVGNAAPYSEYNAFCDPDALQIVIDSGVPVTLFPLEAAENCKKNSGGDMEYSAAAVTSFLNDNIQTKDYYVKCETRAGENQGWTIIDRLGKYKKQANVTVVI